MYPPKVAIILLNWNQEADTSECLKSLAKIDHGNYEIVLVDNASRDGSADKIKNKFPNITLIKNPENLGFAEGNNVGLRYFAGKEIDYFLLLNNDTIVKNDFLSKLVEAGENDPSAGVLGPKIYFFDHPDEIWFAGGYFNRITGKTYHRGLGEKDTGQYDSPVRADFVSGCAMLVRKNVMDQLKGLDPDYFFSHEDVDLCLRAGRLGAKIVYVPGSVVWHKFARAAGGRFSPLYVYYRVRNGLLLLKKNRFPWHKLIYNLIVNPVKMLCFAIITGNFKGAFAVIRGVRDFTAGRYGRGKGF